MRDIIRRVVRGNRNLSWQEFESFFCQSQGNFSALLLSLPKNKQEAEKFGKLTRAKASSDDDTKEEFTVDDDLEEEALERLEDDMFDGDEDDEIQEYMINREDYDGELEEKFNAPFESYMVYAGSAKRSAMGIRLKSKNTDRKIKGHRYVVRSLFFENHSKNQHSTQVLRQRTSLR